MSSIRIGVYGKRGAYIGTVKPVVGTLLPDGEITKVNNKSISLSKPDRDKPLNETSLNVLIWDLPIILTTTVINSDGEVHQLTNYERAMITIANEDTDDQLESMREITTVALRKINMKKEPVADNFGSMSIPAMFLTLATILGIRI